MIVELRLRIRLLNAWAFLIRTLRDLSISDEFSGDIFCDDPAILAYEENILVKIMIFHILACYNRSSYSNGDWVRLLNRPFGAISAKKNDGQTLNCSNFVASERILIKLNVNPIGKYIRKLLERSF